MARRLKFVETNSLEGFSRHALDATTKLGKVHILVGPSSLLDDFQYSLPEGCLMAQIQRVREATVSSYDSEWALEKLLLLLLLELLPTNKVLAIFGNFTIEGSRIFSAGSPSKIIYLLHKLALSKHMEIIVGFPETYNARNNTAVRSEQPMHYIASKWNF